MKRGRKRQYTIRSVPSAVGEAMRRCARTEGKSLNQIALEVLRRGVGLDQAAQVYDDLDALIGTWQDDPEFDAALREQDVVVPDL